MSDTTSIWIVPYIAEEVIGVTKVHSLWRYRWPREDELFEVCLGRITSGLLNKDDPLISKLLDDIWRSEVECGISSAFLQIGLSHGYGSTSDKLIIASMPYVSDPYLYTYEKYWDFYLAVAEDADDDKIIQDVYEGAIMNRFACLDALTMCPPFIRAAIKYYRRGDTQLYNIIVDGIRKNAAEFDDIRRLIQLDDFDDIIIDAIRLTGMYTRTVYTVALSMGKDDLVERVAPYLNVTK